MSSLKHNWRMALVLALVTIGLLAAKARAERRYQDDATVAAENWLTVIKQSSGGWGRYDDATLASIESYRIDGHVVGYIAHIKPRGFVAISAFTELPPIKAFSTDDDFLLDCDQPGFKIVKRGLEHSASFVLQTADSRGLDANREIVIESKYADSWNNLLNSPMALVKPLGRGNKRGDYGEGAILLEDEWGQRPPYNDWCPESPDSACDWSGFFSPTTDWEDSEFYNTNAWAGCVAVSGSQTMHYWAWPPRGSGAYTDGWDWPNMQNHYVWDHDSFWDYDFYNEDDELITRVQADAVAELMRDVGREVDMDYGCDGSSAFVYTGPLGNSLQNALRHVFRFHDAPMYALRPGFFDWEWWNLITDDLNKNRVIPYQFTGHAFMVDGWIEAGAEFIHVNYGHGPTATCDGHLKNFWYGLADNICGHEPWEQSALVWTRPVNCLGPNLSGNYEQYGSFQYRYFDRDASGSEVSFESGQFLQFHNGGTVTGTGSGDQHVRFEGLGSTVSRTFLYTRGDKTRGIKLQQGGVLHLKNDGSIGFF